MRTTVRTSTRKNDPVAVAVFLLAYVAILLFLIAPAGTFDPDHPGPAKIASFSDN